jgi:hypothetical protein
MVIRLTIATFDADIAFTVSEMIDRHIYASSYYLSCLLFDNKLDDART